MHPPGTPRAHVRTPFDLGTESGLAPLRVARCGGVMARNDVLMPEFMCVDVL